MRPRLTYANVVATLALVIAVSGGAAYAANTVFSSDIVDGQVKTPDLANGAVANGKLADGAVTSDKVADDSLKGRDVLDNALKGADIDESTLSSIGGGGPAGGDLTGTYPNPQIAVDAVEHSEIADDAVGFREINAGAVGASEITNYTLVQDSISIGPAGAVGSVAVSCGPGGRLITGGGGFEFASGDLAESQPDGFSGWFVRGQNNGSVAQDLRVEALCLAP